MSIRAYCPRCKKWVDVCQDAFGFKFVKLGLGDDGEYGVWRHLDETPFEFDDTGDVYKCGCCYREILPGKGLVEDLLQHPERDPEVEFPDGVPGEPNYCYDTEDMRLREEW